MDPKFRNASERLARLKAAAQALSANAQSRSIALWSAARSGWDAFRADRREVQASVTLASVLAAGTIVWGLSGTDAKPGDPAPVVVAVAEEPAAPVPVPSAPAEPPAGEIPAAPPPAVAGPAPAQRPATPPPVVKAEPAKPAPEAAAAKAPEPKPATKETKIAKTVQPKSAAPAAPDWPDDFSTGLLSSAKTPVDMQARSYEAFARDIDKIAKMEFKTPKDVRAAFDQLLKHKPETLAEGWIAHSARVVAANETFSKAIGEEVERRGRDTVLARIAKDPRYVNKLPGAYEALDSLMKQLARDTNKLAKLGDRFIQTAYAFQKQKWGEADILRRPRHADAGTVRVIPAGLFSRDEEPAAPVGVTQRVLLLAASLDAGGPDASANKELLHDPGLAQCMRWARLNLNQCLAAAYFPSEQAYCTGKHGITEVNDCWAKLLPTKS